MKQLIKYTFIFASMFTIFSCSKEKENEIKMNFYLSQPRDPELCGWWTNKQGADSSYSHFEARGIVTMNINQDINGILRGTPSEYWYTKDNICHIFLRNDSYFKGSSLESQFKYEIINDSLWLGNKHEDFVLKFWGKRTYPRL